MSGVFSEEEWAEQFRLNGGHRGGNGQSLPDDISPELLNSQPSIVIAMGEKSSCSRSFAAFRRLVTKRDEEILEASDNLAAAEMAQELRPMVPDVFLLFSRIVLA